MVDKVCVHGWRSLGPKSVWLFIGLTMSEGCLCFMEGQVVRTERQKTSALMEVGRGRCRRRLLFAECTDHGQNHSLALGGWVFHDQISKGDFSGLQDGEGGNLFLGVCYISGDCIGLTLCTGLRELCASVHSSLPLPLPSSVVSGYPRGTWSQMFGVELGLLEKDTH